MGPRNRWGRDRPREGAILWIEWRAVPKRLNRSRCRFCSDSCGSKEPCIRWGPDWTNPFAAMRGDDTAMRPFAILLWTLVIVIIIIIVIKADMCECNRFSPTLIFCCSDGAAGAQSVSCYMPMVSTGHFGSLKYN